MKRDNWRLLLTARGWLLWWWKIEALKECLECWVLLLLYDTRHLLIKLLRYYLSFMFASRVNDTSNRSRRPISQLNLGRRYLIQLRFKEKLSLWAYRHHLLSVALVSRHRVEDRVPKAERRVRNEATHALIRDTAILLRLALRLVAAAVLVIFFDEVCGWFELLPGGGVLAIPRWVVGRVGFNVYIWRFLLTAGLADKVIDHLMWCWVVEIIFLFVALLFCRLLFNLCIILLLGFKHHLFVVCDKVLIFGQLSSVFINWNIVWLLHLIAVRSCSSNRIMMMIYAYYYWL